MYGVVESLNYTKALVIHMKRSMIRVYTYAGTLFTVYILFASTITSKNTPFLSTLYGYALPPSKHKKLKLKEWNFIPNIPCYGIKLIPIPCVNVQHALQGHCRCEVHCTHETQLRCLHVLIFIYLCLPEVNPLSWVLTLERCTPSPRDRSILIVSYIINSNVYIIVYLSRYSTFVRALT